VFQETLGDDGGEGFVEASQVLVTEVDRAQCQGRGEDETQQEQIASSEYRLAAAAAWTPYTAPFAVSTEGESTFEYRSSDKAGNVMPTLLPSVWWTTNRTALEQALREALAVSETPGEDEGDPRLPVLGTPPLRREHRLYQADWLLRFYGFAPNELLSGESPWLDPQLDPKCAWALRNPGFFPVEVNTAPDAAQPAWWQAGLRGKI
jgi:hypothetical protein